MIHTTLTYGTVPDFHDFKEAFDKAMCDEPSAAHPGLYEITLPNNSDYMRLQDAGLLTQWSSIVPRNQQQARFHSEVVKDTLYGMHACYCYDAAQLYRLIGNLVELHNIDSDEAYAEWAGNFASSILTTLGFEWV